MIEAAIVVILLTAVSLFIQEVAKIPSPMSLVGFVLVGKAFGLDFIHVDDAMFDQIILLMLPILISVDALSLRMEEIKAHSFSLLYLAVVGVILSVVFCVVLNKIILPDYNLTIPAVIALFCMVMATDPIAVSAVFGNFRVPHNLKIMAEGESLFNDATALILFGLAVSMMKSTVEIDVVDTATHSFMVIFGAAFIGLVVGFVGLYLMSLSRSPAVETSLVMAIAYVSYLSAEHFHWSGILATIVSILIANHVISKRIQADERIIEWTENHAMKLLPRLMTRFNYAVVDKANHQSIVQNISFMAAFGATILFISMADLISINKIVEYWEEILAVFVATTIVRMCVMFKFSMIAGRVKYSHKVPFHWWLVLCSAGVKGGISILMLHMLPKSFEHKDLFEAVVVGVVLLSTFIYPLVLMAVMKIFKSRFDRECDDEHANHQAHSESYSSSDAESVNIVKG